MPELHSVGAELSADKGIHQSCIGRAVCFRHYFLGDDAVLFDEVDDVFPVPPVWDGPAKDKLHFSIHDVTISEFDDVFEKAVCLFELVPESQVIL